MPNSKPSFTEVETIFIEVKRRSLSGRRSLQAEAWPEILDNGTTKSTQLSQQQVSFVEMI